MEIYAPLAERIGVQQIKSELQDICFRVLHPEIRESILTRFESIESGKENFVDQIVQQIKNTISTNGMEADVSGRRKTPYSTWMKMKQKDYIV
jgi:GTP pyrophosphokinase